MGSGIVTLWLSSHSSAAWKEKFQILWPVAAGGQGRRGSRMSKARHGLRLLESHSHVFHPILTELFPGPSLQDRSTREGHGQWAFTFLTTWTELISPKYCPHPQSPNLPGLRPLIIGLCFCFTRAEESEWGQALSCWSCFLVPFVTQSTSAGLFPLLQLDPGPLLLFPDHQPNLGS